MKAMIYFFSGTGNSLYTARKIAGALGGAEVISVRCDPASFSAEEAEVIGFVCPVYEWDVPGAFKDFVARLAINPNAYIFMVATCIAVLGKSFETVAALLEEKGARLHYGRAVRCVASQCIAYPPFPPERIMLPYMDKQLQNVCGEIVGHTDDKRVTVCKVLLDLVHGELSAGEHCRALLFCRNMPVGVLDFRLLVGFLDFLQLLDGGEARICPALGDELLCKYMVKLRTLGLLVRAVSTDLDQLATLIHPEAFVIGNAVIGERSDQCLHGTLDFTLPVGILNAEVENAAGLMCQTFIDNCLIHAAEVNKTGGAGSETGDLCALGEVARGIACFDFLDCRCDMREQKLCKYFVIHDDRSFLVIGMRTCPLENGRIKDTNI